MSVKMRQMVEREICLQVVASLLEAGYSLGVNDGEEITIHHSRDAKEIERALFTTDEDYLYVYAADNHDADSTPNYWVRFVYGNDGWDVVCDYLTALESVIGEGTATQKLIDKYAD